MSPAIITVEGLGKRYRLGANRSNERYTALRGVLTDKAKSLFRSRNGFGVSVLILSDPARSRYLAASRPCRSPQSLHSAFQLFDV
jgi:hypothetical protein